MPSAPPGVLHGSRGSQVESGTWLAQSYWEWVLEVEKHNLSTSALSPKSKIAWPIPATDIEEVAALEEPFER